MRKINCFLILCAVLVISSCSKSEILSEEESKEQVNVSFLAQPDVVVTAGTRAAAVDLVDPAKFSFYAFKTKKYFAASLFLCTGSCNRAAGTKANAKNERSLLAYDNRQCRSRN